MYLWSRKGTLLTKRQNKCNKLNHLLCIVTAIFGFGGNGGIRGDITIISGSRQQGHASLVALHWLLPRICRVADLNSGRRQEKRGRNVIDQVRVYKSLLQYLD